MSHSTSTWLAHILCILCIILTGIGLALEGVNRAAHAGSFVFLNEVAIAVCFSVVGMLIARQQPSNSIGWFFLGIGLFEAIPLFAVPYAVYTFRVNPGALPGGDLGGWIGYWIATPGFTLIPFVLSLFPDGRLLSPRWRWLTWVTVTGVTLGALGLMWESWPLRGQALLPWLMTADHLEGSVPDWYYNVSSILLVISAVGSLIVIGLRFFRSSGTERQQMKWCVFAIAFVAGLQVLVIFASLTEDSPGSAIFSQLVFALDSLAFIGLAVAFGFAILKYRLYDIDIIINRTLVYGAFTLILTTIWVTTTTLIQRIVVEISGSQDVVTSTVISTVVVISFFQPLRSAIENWVNERFYPENLDLMRDFGEISAVTFELSEFTDLIARRICALMQSSYVVVFLKNGDGLYEPAAHWPINLHDLNAIPLPKQIYDRWGRARAVQLPDGELFRLLVPLSIPRLRQEEVNAILALGPRPGGQGYSWDDRRGLTNFGRKIGLKLFAAQYSSEKRQTQAK